MRGLTIAGMIVVNTPGSWEYVYPPLRHAEWNGITPTDMVFPFFLFIVGVSIALAFTKRLQQNAPKGDMYKKIISRSIKIFLLGVFLNVFPQFDLTDIRFAGVLQRIAIVYLVCAFLFLNSDWKKILQVGVILLVGYWLAMYLIPVPEIGMGVVEPGKNFAHWLDSFLVPGKMYQVTWDPEGVASTFPAIATGISGMLAGVIIVNKEKTTIDKLVLLFYWGFMLFVLGSIWNWFFPINKNLWTSSYVLYTSGLAMLTLAASIYFVDLKNHQSWAKFGVIYGSNAITVYVIAGMLPTFFNSPWWGGQSIQGGFMKGLSGLGIDPSFVSLLYALTFMMVCYIPAYILYKKKIFIKV